jgi:hypothetical protein
MAQKDDANGSAQNGEWSRRIAGFLILFLGGVSLL